MKQTKNPEKEKKQKDQESLQKYKEGVNSYAKYFSAGIQLVSPVILGAFVGYWIDNSQQNDKPIWTIILSSVMIVVALYLFLRQFLKG